MAKYLKTSFVRNLEMQMIEKEISYGKMLDLIQDEIIKNYKNENDILNKIKRFFTKYKK